MVFSTLESLVNQQKIAQCIEQLIMITTENLKIMLQFDRVKNPTGLKLISKGKKLIILSCPGFYFSHHLLPFTHLLRRMANRLERCAEHAMFRDLFENFFQRVDDTVILVRFGDLVLQKLRIDKTVEVQTHVVCNQQADHPQRCPAQRERVFRSRGFLVNRPEACQRVELVGQSHGDGDRVGRHVV